MNETPETDALANSINADPDITRHEYDFVEMKALAHKLEREKNAAIRELENLKASSIHTCHAQCQRPMCVLRRERDEAREDAEHWKIEYEIVEARLHGAKHDRDNGIISEKEIIPKLERERNALRQLLDADSQGVDAYLGVCVERDEAREQNAKLRDIAERAMLFCDMRMRDSLRAELEQLKEGGE